MSLLQTATQLVPMAALTQCSSPPQPQVLGLEHALGLLEPMQRAVYRSRAAQSSKAMDSVFRLLAQPLRHAGS